jgi:hypothetical protein
MKDNDRWRIGEHTYLTRQDARADKYFLEDVKKGMICRVKKYERVD